MTGHEQVTSAGQGSRRPKPQKGDGARATAAHPKGGAQATQCLETQVQENKENQPKTTAAKAHCSKLFTTQTMGQWGDFLFNHRGFFLGGERDL